MKKLLICLTFLSFGITIFAQTVTVYDPYNATGDANPNKKNSSIKNNIQWNYSLLTRGAFALTYERCLNNYISAEIGGGLTFFSPNVFYDMFDEEDYDYDYDVEDNTSYGTGVFLSAGVKIYPKEMDDFEGVYAYPVARYRSYNYETIIEDYTSYDYTTNEYTTIQGTTFNRSEETTDFALMIGYQTEGWSDILYNTYIGFGYSTTTSENLQTDSNTGEYILVEEKESKPNLFLGFSLGFTF